MRLDRAIEHIERHSGRRDLDHRNLPPRRLRTSVVHDLGGAQNRFQTIDMAIMVECRLDQLVERAAALLDAGHDIAEPRLVAGRAFRRIPVAGEAVALVILGGLVGSSLIGVLASKGPHLLGLHLISVVGFVLSGVFGVWLLWGVFRSGRL